MGVLKNLVAFRYKDEIKDYDVFMANHVYAQHTLGDTFLCHQRFGIGRRAKAGKVILYKSRVEPFLWNRILYLCWFWASPNKFKVC